MWWRCAGGRGGRGGCAGVLLWAEGGAWHTGRFQTWDVSFSCCVCVCVCFGGCGELTVDVYPFFCSVWATCILCAWLVFM
jgi:hypothetical protein